MYYYIVDPQKISQKKFERVQNVLYSSLSEFRIAGEVVRATGVRTINQLVENAFAHEAKTIVAVGNDETLHDVVNALQGREMVVGFIPIMKSALAEIFGIRDIVQAAKTIAFRRVENLDLGVVGSYYFLSQISFGSPKAENLEIKFSADDQFQASKNAASGIIANIRPLGNPSDGLLDVLLLPKLSFWQSLRYRTALKTTNYEKIPKASVIHAKKIEIISPQGLALKLGNRIVVKTPATISVVAGALRIIVGKDRNF